MIMTPEEYKGLVPTTQLNDAQLKLMLDGIEAFIKSSTNNDFARFSDSNGEIIWPNDIKLGVLNLMRWDEANRDRIGVSSETISRHSVTYSDISGADTDGGYPAGLTSFLDPYRRARF